MTTEEFKSLVDAYCKDRKDPTPAQELIYLGEVQDRCPKCGKPLVKKGTRKVNKDFEIAHIFPCNPTDDDMAVLEGVELYGQNSETMDNKMPFVMIVTKIMTIIKLRRNMSTSLP